MSDKQDIEKPGSGQEIVPVAFNSTEVRATDRDPNTSSSVRRVGIVASAVILFFSVLAVIFVLPRYIDNERLSADANPTHPRAVDKISDNDKPPAAAPSLDDAAIAELRLTNQGQLEQALELKGQLESKNVDIWAADEFAEANQNIVAGEKAYREQRYPAAQKRYATAIESMETLLARTDKVVATVIEDGYAAIDAQDSVAARKAFEHALQIAANNNAARKGLARAETLDKVVALANEGQGYEQLGDLDTALSRYNEAFALDSEATGVANAISRIKQTQRDAEFRRIMSTGFAAYDRQQDAKAKAAFVRALKLDPTATEARDAHAQVENRILANKIANHLSAATKLERQEKWTDAAAHYRSAVRLDRELDGAANSAKIADSRGKLDARLSATLSKPHRLSSDQVHREALALLDKARGVSKPGPRLAGQITRLSNAIEHARTPIAVTILSDNLTDVTLYKVGGLGRFDSRRLTVLPGRYIIVGKRDGFRDVRVEFNVSRSHPDAMITVRCEQKLAFGS